MTPLFLTAQIAGFFAAALAVVSRQCKRMIWLIVLQAASILCYTVQYLLFGINGNGSAYAAIIPNIFAIAFYIVTMLLLKKDKPKKTFILILFCIGIVICTVFTYNGNIVSLIPGIDSIVSYVVIWRGTSDTVRKKDLFFSIPIWIAYNICVFSIFGVISGTALFISIIVYFIREHKQKISDKKNDEPDIICRDI